MREIDATALYYLAKQYAGQVDHIYIHWTAGWYGSYFDDYHINIDGDGTILLSTEDLTEYLSHTWRRNSRSIGIALCCCGDATAKADGTINFGSHPPTKEQIEACAIVVDVLCAALGLELTNPTDENGDPIISEDMTVLTHCEAAELDDYGPSTTCERWDLWYLPDYINGGIKPGGVLIRGKAMWYYQHGY